jgi:hypothetical protein
VGEIATIAAFVEDDAAELLDFLDLEDAEDTDRRFE